MAKNENLKAYICDKCGIWSETKPKKCICGNNYFIKKKFKEVEL